MTIDSKHSLTIAPNLLQRDFTAIAPNLLQRDFTASAPNQVCTEDITYIANDEVWLYLPVDWTCLAARWWAGVCSRTCKAYL